MKKQQPARLFRALIVTSTLSGLASQALGQEGVANTNPQEGTDGVANLGQNRPDVVAPPAYALPQYMPQYGGMGMDWYQHGGDGRNRAWQDDIGARYRFETRIGEWIGSNDQGDASFNFMQPWRISDGDWIFYIDGRGTATYNGKGAASGGLGVRHYDATRERVYGFAAYYDYDNGNFNDYQQVGLSFQSIGTWFDFYINGYLPVGNDKNTLSTRFQNPVFTGNTVMLDRIDRIESSYAGLNAEVGGPLPLLGRYGFRGYVGGYYFQADDDQNFAGTSVRIDAQVTDDVVLGINVTNDRVFDTQVFGTVSLTLPDGRPATYFRPKRPQERLLDRDERRYRATVHRRDKTTKVNGTGMLVAPVPGGGNQNAISVSNIVFVNPNQSTQGTGTFENPLRTFTGFAGAGPNTLFVIDDGDLTGQLTLQTNSRLFSVNYINSNPVFINTPAGPVALPALDPNAVQPVWSNPTGGTLVTITGNNTEVAGITFDGRTNAGVQVSNIITGTNIAGFSIHDNTFRNYTNAITLNNATGTIAAGNPGLIYSNFFFGQSGASFNGVNITNVGPGTLDLELGATEYVLSRRASALGNFAYGNTGEDTNGNGILDAGEDRDGNNTLDTGVAFAVTARNQAVINANVVGNVTGIEDANRDGVLLTGDLNRNGILDPGETALANGQLDFGEDANHNGVLDKGNSEGFRFTAGSSQSTINLRLLNNLVSGNVGTGITLSANSSTINAFNLGEDVNGNGLLDAGEDINEDLNNNSRLDTGEDRNSDGFLNRGNADGRLTGGNLISGNQVLRNGGDGMRVDIVNNGSVSLLVVNNEFGRSEDRSTGNGGAGLNLNANAGNLTLQLGFLYDEDANLNSILDIGEDLNGNSALDIPQARYSNDIVANRGGGVLFNLTGTAQGRIGAIGNTIEGIGGASVGFLLTGDTTGVPFDLTNNAQIGNNLSRFQWDIAAANLQFNTTGVNGVVFQPVNNSNTLTGLTSVNGTSNPFTVNNLATNLDLVFNDFNPINGVLDTGEDTNNNGALDTGEDLPETFSFQLDVDRAGVPANVIGNEYIGSIVTATFASGQVVTGTMQAVTGNATASQFVPTSNNLGTGTGFGVNVGGVSTLLSSVIRNNTISNFGGGGVAIGTSGEGTINDILIRNNIISGNGSGTGSAPYSNGLSLTTSNVANGILNAQVLLNTISDNAGGAINVAASGGTLNVSRIEQNTIDNNGSGISLAATQAATLHARVTNNNITDSVRRVTGVTTDTTGNGLIVTANAATVILDEIALNTISNNDGDGMNFDASNGGTIRVTPTEDFNRNNILDPGEDANEDLNNNGVRDGNEPDTNADGFLNRGNGNGLLDRGILSNSLTNNDGLAFGITTTGGTVDLAEVRGTAIITNTTGTGNIAIVGNNGTIRAAFRGNNIVGDFNNNPAGGPGLLVSATGGSFNVDVGGTGTGDGNVFTGNRGVGVAFQLSDTGTGSFTVINNTITRIADDNNVNTPYQGDGVNVALVSSTNPVDATAILTRSEVTGNIIGDFTNTNLGVQGSGVAVLAFEKTTIQDLLIENNQIGHVGNNNVVPLGTTININSQILGGNDSGIKFERYDDAAFLAVNPRNGADRAITVRGNVVRNNIGQLATSPVHGLTINAMNSMGTKLDFSILNNEFSGNTGNGLHFETQADATIDVNLTNNLIENNLLNGVQLTGVENTATDFETQGGVWIQNTIRNNGRNGILITGASGDDVPLIIGQLGTDPLTGRSLGNHISSNKLDGISISSGGFSQINNNLIELNSGSGINIDAPSVLIRGDVLRSNSIVNNLTDGVQWRSTGGTTTLLMYGNNIDGNSARGIDILNFGNGNANIQIGDDSFAGANHVNSNGQEGIYIVNTASTNQSNTNLSTAAMAADGSGLSQVNMILDISRNEVVGNNNNGSFLAGGIVLRVGTNFSDITAFTQADASGFGSNAVDVGGNTVANANGRINARINNNTVQGNLGDDVYIESYVSTVAPAASAGTWDAMTFTVTGYQSDPLARLNLVFKGNTGDSLNVNNFGAFYSNAEGTFKSRLNTATPGGPFTSATRPRSATAIPIRNDGIFMLDPPIGATAGSLFADLYEYPGLGQSTFRIEGDFDVSGFPILPGNDFILEGQPFSIFGGSGWGQVAPGTFEFDSAFTLP